MRIALVHDYIKEYGGAERVLEALHEMYPDAPIYTSLYFPKFLGPHKKRFEKMDIRSTWMQYIPFSYKLISPLRLLSPIAFKTLNLSKYDVIITSQTGAYFPNLVNKGEARLMSYTHTPPRYLYGYKTARDWKKHKLVAIFAEIANHFLRMIDYAASRNVDQFIANSQEVAARIQKFYRREAFVVYPPVEISSQFTIHGSQLKKGYYLAGGRLARAKGMDVIVEAFIKNGKPLKVFGKGFAGYEEELKNQILKIKNTSQKSKIEFIGEVTDEEKLSLMRDAKAYIFASYDEDFGITPVEAMSMGTPVIAYKSGGVKETVVDGKTGVFYDENTSDKLVQAIEKFETLEIKSAHCQKQAEQFSKDTFIKNIKKRVAS